jgi:pimeloyl-ACP methyl ester carboxylesterase
MVAQELALAEPERVRTLTLGCTYCGGSGAGLTDETVVNALAAAILSGDPARKIRTGWEFNVSPRFATAAGNFERFSELAACDPVALPMLFAQVQAIMAHDTSERLREIGRRRSSSTAAPTRCSCPQRRDRRRADPRRAPRAARRRGAPVLLGAARARRELVREHVAAARA